MFKKLDIIFEFMKDEELLKFYRWGWELACKNKKFPQWFNSELEKRACLIGYIHFTLGDDNINFDIKSDEEVLKEIKNG